jgi:RNA polymerase subunit RPABC4/transcription elongation factor Spt4
MRTLSDPLSPEVAMNCHCRDCGAVVERTDRFCPACGTPNADTKFHPKFGPMPRGFEAEILYEVATPDQPACLRCERPITAGSRWCQGCGLDLALSWTRFRQRRLVEEWERGEHVARPFRAPGRLGRALRLALGLAALTTLVAGATRLVGPDEAEMGPLNPVVTGSLTLAAVALAAVLAAAWARRALGNLPALAVLDRRRRRWPAIGRDVVWPKRVLDDLWRTASADLPPCSQAWRVDRRPRMTSVWWALVMARAALVLAAGLIDPAPSSAPVLLAAAGLAWSGSFVVLGVIVRRIDARQAHRLLVVRPDRRGEVAAPVADVAVELSASVPTRLEALRPGPDRGSDGTPPTALRRPPSNRRPVWGKY